MKKRKIKRNVGFSLYSEALLFASTTLGFTPQFLEHWEVLGKGLTGVPTRGAGSARAALAAGAHRAQVWVQSCAVPLLSATPQQGQPGYFLCVCSAVVTANKCLREPSAVSS